MAKDSISKFKYYKIKFVKPCIRTFPQPGTSTPSIGLGISILLTTPYLLHSSLMSSKMSSYSSSSLSSSGVTYKE